MPQKACERCPRVVLNKTIQACDMLHVKSFIVDVFILPQLDNKYF